MLKNTGKLIQRSNAEIFDGLRGSMSAAYRARVPKADQGDASKTIRALQKYEPHMNEFVQALVNRIGLELFRRNSWTNPLGIFKLGLMEYGDTVEEVQVGLLKAHHYNNSSETSMADIYGTELPEVQSSFHRINRQVFYKVTITEAMLSRAFLTSNGLSSMIQQLMESPTTSDNVDEFLHMTQLLQEYDANGGFYRVNIPDVAASTSTEADAKAALRAIRATAGNLNFVNPKYNAANMEVAVDTEKLVLLVSPEFRAAVDVNALAAAFNLEYAQAISRIIDIPADRLGAGDIQAILTTEDFFVVMDTVFKTAEIQDPTKLSWNHFLHHHSIISCSRFVPAIAFTTGPGTEDVPDDYAVTGISDIKIDPLDDGNFVTIAADGSTEVVRGTAYQLESHGVASDGTEAAVRWTVEGESTFTTFISPDGVLQVSGLEDGYPFDPDGAGAAPVKRVIDVRATTVWIDPDNTAAAPFTKTAKLTLTGDTLEVWPVPAE